MQSATFIFDGCDAFGKKWLGCLVPIHMSTGNKPARVAAEKRAGIAGACISKKKRRYRDVEYQGVVYVGPLP